MIALDLSDDGPGIPVRTCARCGSRHTAPACLRCSCDRSCVSVVDPLLSPEAQILTVLRGGWATLATLCEILVLDLDTICASLERLLEAGRVASEGGFRYALQLGGAS